MDSYVAKKKHEIPNLSLFFSALLCVPFPSPLPLPCSSPVPALPLHSSISRFSAPVIFLCTSHLSSLSLVPFLFLAVSTVRSFFLHLALARGLLPFFTLPLPSPLINVVFFHAFSTSHNTLSLKTQKWLGLYREWEI